jgi:hypothetical protein
MINISNKLLHFMTNPGMSKGGRNGDLSCENVVFAFFILFLKIKNISQPHPHSLCLSLFHGFMNFTPRESVERGRKITRDERPKNYDKI